MNDFDEVVYLTGKQWDNRMKTIATKRLHRFRRALTSTSMSHYFNDAIIELRSDPPSEILVVNITRYKELRALWMNNSDDEMYAMMRKGLSKEDENGA